jgi:phage-related protein
MQALGVNMTAASVTARALEMGLAATTDALTPAMLAQARYSIILDQTKTAQGDFTKTSEGLANQQRIMDAQWKDLSATVGQALLPVQLALVSVLNDLTQRVLPPLAAFITQKVVPAMDAIASIIRTSVGPMIEQAQAWFTALGATMQGQATGPMSYLSTWFAQNMPRIQLIVQNVTNALTQFWTDHGARIMAVVGPLLEWLVSFWQNNMQTTLDIVSAILQLLTGDFEGAGETLRGILTRWADFFTNIITTIVNGIRDRFREIDWGGIGHSIIEGIANGIRNGAGAIVDAARNAAEAAYNAARNLLGIHSPSSVAAEDIGKPFAQGIGVGISDELQRMSSSLSGGINGMLGAIAPQAAGAGGMNITINVSGYADGAGVGGAARDGVLSALRAAGLR